MRTRCRGTGPPPSAPRLSRRHRRWQGRFRPGPGTGASPRTPGRAAAQIIRSLIQRSVSPDSGRDAVRRSRSAARSRSSRFLGSRPVEPDGPGAAAFQFVELGDQAVEFRYGSGSGKVVLKPDHVRQKGLGTFPATVQRNPGGDGKEDCGGPADGPLSCPPSGGWKGSGGWQCFEEELPYEQGNVPQSRMRA